MSEEKSTIAEIAEMEPTERKAALDKIEREIPMKRIIEENDNIELERRGIDISGNNASGEGE